MAELPTIHEVIQSAETAADIERLDAIVDAMAAQALKDSQDLAEKYDLEVAYLEGDEVKIGELEQGRIFRALE